MTQQPCFLSKTESKHHSYEMGSSLSTLRTAARREICGQSRLSGGTYAKSERSNTTVCQKVEAQKSPAVESHHLQVEKVCGRLAKIDSSFKDGSGCSYQASSSESNGIHASYSISSVTLEFVFSLGENTVAESSSWPITSVAPGFTQQADATAFSSPSPRKVLAAITKVSLATPQASPRGTAGQAHQYSCQARYHADQSKVSQTEYFHNSFTHSGQQQSSPDITLGTAFHGLSSQASREEDGPSSSTPSLALSASRSSNGGPPPKGPPAQPGPRVAALLKAREAARANRPVVLRPAPWDRR